MRRSDQTISNYCKKKNITFSAAAANSSVVMEDQDSSDDIDEDEEMSEDEQDAAPESSSSSSSSARSVHISCGQECDLSKCSIYQIVILPYAKNEDIKNKILSCPDIAKHTIDGVPLPAYIFAKSKGSSWHSILQELESKLGTEIFQYIDGKKISTLHRIMTDIKQDKLTNKLLAELDPNLLDINGMTPLESAIQYFIDHKEIYPVYAAAIKDHILVLVSLNTKLNINKEECEKMINKISNKIRRNSVLEYFHSALRQREQLLNGTSSLLELQNLLNNNLKEDNHEIEDLANAAAASSN